MPQTIIYLDEKLDEEVKDYADSHKVTKHDAVLRLVKIGLKVKEDKNVK